MASGGHVALRVGDLVYHHQQGDDEVFHLVRHEWAEFAFIYGTLQNRPIHLASLDASREVSARVRDHLTGAHLLQQRRLSGAEGRRLDRELAEALTGARPGVAVRGAGLLDPASPGDPHAVALREAVSARYGPDYLAERIADVEEALAALPAEALAQRRHPLAEREALLALQAARGLAEGTVGAPAPAPLAAAARASLAAFGENQREVALLLLRSPRPDLGRALFLAAARYQAVQRSLAQGHAIYLDPFPDRVARLDARAARQRADELRALAAEETRLYREEQARLLDGAPLSERGYNRLETLAARAREYARGAAGEPTRQTTLAMVPGRSREVAPLRRVPGSRGLVAAAQEAERAALHALQERYPYDLILRNCVTELVGDINRSLGDEAAVRDALGGYLAPGARLGFIPFVAFDQVVAALRIRAVERLPSYRERRLEALQAEARSPLLLALREENTLTTTVYEPRDRDGSFLLFTDQRRLARPLFGLLNVGWALADTSLGLLTAPFDRGRRLVRGGKGMLFSAPELVFQNIRKGSFDAATLAPDP